MGCELHPRLPYSYTTTMTSNMRQVNYSISFYKFSFYFCVFLWDFSIQHLTFPLQLLATPILCSQCNNFKLLGCCFATPILASNFM